MMVAGVGAGVGEARAESSMVVETGGLLLSRCSRNKARFARTSGRILPISAGGNFLNGGGGESENSSLEMELKADKREKQIRQPE